jgi:hypothetical protein
MPFHENRPVAKRSILRQNKCDLTAAERKRLAISGLQAVQIFQDPGNCSVTKPSRRFNVFTGCLLLERILKDSQERRVQFLELIGALAAEPVRTTSATTTGRPNAWRSSSSSAQARLINGPESATMIVTGFFLQVFTVSIIAPGGPKGRHPPNAFLAPSTPRESGRHSNGTPDKVRIGSPTP